MTLGVAPSFSANALAVKLAIPSSLTNCKADPMIASLLNLTLGGIRLLSRNICYATVLHKEYHKIEKTCQEKSENHKTKKPAH